MPAGSDDKHERQYEHIKRSARERGESVRRARPEPASRRGGERSHSGAQGTSRDQRYEEARKRDVRGRSSMSGQQPKNAPGR
ncbi:plasmid stabilization protein [Streptomyces sp. NPDC021080]|uniref:plasmid stabilization protein n=1 Tax=Streptomyces sp. NPDC021080 TaxID=3365110 RepID=UPI003792CC99